jgi:hypothetical protein
MIEKAKSKVINIILFFVNASLFFQTKNYKTTHL